MTDRITLKRYRALAQTYGADLERWPANERLAVERLTRDYEDIDALQDARQLDTLLNQWPDPDVPDGLAERVAVSLRQAAHRDIGGHQPIELTNIPGKGKPTFGSPENVWIFLRITPSELRLGA
ncbi:hypothetical protein DFI02_1131 [Rhizobium sp. PP-F2F-G20b]|nr:hypothetical protein DFI02_1131 [Rhizobium sp. PP-F2F-G20b]